MKHRLTLLLLALTGCQEISTPVSPPDILADRTDASGLQRLHASAAATPVVPGEVIVKLRGSLQPETFARGLGLTLQRRGYRSEFSVLAVSRGSERAEAARLMADPRVEYAEPNYLRQVSGCPIRLWAFENPGACHLNFDPALDPQGRSGPVTSYYSTRDADEDAGGGDVPTGYATLGAPVVIGSIDTGVDFTHEQLRGRLIAGRDWVDGDNDPSDLDGHGTHTAGTMAGSSVGVAGIAGAAANVRVLVQRVCGPTGCPTSAVVSAIYAAADYPGMVAINLSLGGGSESRSEQEAIDYAVRTRNVLVVAAAGNDGAGLVSCPACDPNAISVAATNWNDGLAYYSNYGTGLDLAAPGGELYSNATRESGIYSSIPGGYAYYQGTSMAAPQVTGTAAVVASVLGLRGAALRTQLESTARDLGTMGYDVRYGNGRLDTYRAVTSRSGSPPPHCPGGHC